MRSKIGYLASSLQALSSVLLLGASTLLISTAATHVPIMMLMTLVVLVRAFAIGRASFRYVERLALHDSAFRMLERVRVKVFKKLEPIAPVGLRSFGRGDLVARMVEDVDELQNLQLRVLPVILQSAISTLAVFGLVLSFAPQVAVAVFVIMVLSAGLAFVVSYFSGSKSQTQVAEQRAKLYASLTDLSERRDVLEAFGWRTSAESELAEKSRALVKIEKLGSRATGLAGGVLVLGLAISQLAAANLGSMVVTTGTANRVLLASFVLLPTAVFEFYQLSLPAVGAFKRYKASKGRVDAILGLRETKFDGEVDLGSFENLSFKEAGVSYDTERSIDLPNFDLSAGASIAILGRSGSGKSSLANLLVGFLPATQGEVLLNGKPISEYSHESLRTKIGLVEQSSSLLIGSVAANLRIAKPEATDAELIEVLQKVGLWAMLQRREGLDTEVGENGSKLSGGEASRIGLARVLLANRQLIILDEPTAALDRELAHRLISDLVRVVESESRTLILITHDPDLVGYCDNSVSF